MTMTRGELRLFEEFASTAFWDHHHSLPDEIRELSDQAFARLKEYPEYPSLHFKNVGRFWSARVGTSYRALAVEAGDALVWFWIGNHSDYERLIK